MDGCAGFVNLGGKKCGSVLFWLLCSDMCEYEMHYPWFCAAWCTPTYLCVWAQRVYITRWSFCSVQTHTGILLSTTLIGSNCTTGISHSLMKTKSNMVSTPADPIRHSQTKCRRCTDSRRQNYQASMVECFEGFAVYCVRTTVTLDPLITATTGPSARMRA